MNAEVENPFRIGLEPPRIELRAKHDWIVCDPSFNHALRIDEFSIGPLSETYISSGLEVLQDGTDRPERYCRSRGDLTIVCL
jgi:hypothetical protein